MVIFSQFVAMLIGAVAILANRERLRFYNSDSPACFVTYAATVRICFDRAIIGAILPVYKLRFLDILPAFGALGYVFVH
jgi:hypothetical protein